MQRIRELGLLQALVDGREDLIHQVLLDASSVEGRREREQEPERDRAEVRQPAPPRSSRSAAHGVREHLGSRQSLRLAMLVHEVLAPPKALRSE